MSIQDRAQEARQRQEAERQELARKESKARPDPMHRAMVFVLKQAALMNRDAAREAHQHIAALDAAPELEADPAAIAEVEAPQIPGANPPQPTNTSGSQSEPATPTAQTLKTSKRFRKN